MTSLHKRICGILYPILLKTAAQQRSVHQDNGDEDERATRIRKILENDSIKLFGNTGTEVIRKLCFELTGAKILESPLGTASKVFAPFTVLFGTFDKTANSLAICLHEKGHYLKLTGELGNFTIETKRIASDDQIKQFLEDLTPAQLRFIMANAIFQPMMTQLYEEQEEIVPDKQPEPTVQA